MVFIPWFFKAGKAGF